MQFCWRYAWCCYWVLEFAPKVDLKITYDAIVSFADPSASFGLILNNNNNNKKEIHEQKNLKKESKIIKLADFKKINPNNNG